MPDYVILTRGEAIRLLAAAIEAGENHEAPCTLRGPRQVAMKMLEGLPERHAVTCGGCGGEETVCGCGGYCAPGCHACLRQVTCGECAGAGVTYSLRAGAQELSER